MKKDNLKRATAICDEIDNLEAHKDSLLTHLKSSDQVRQLRLVTDMALNPFVFQNMILDEYAGPDIFNDFTTAYIKAIKDRLENLRMELETL